MTPVLNVLYIHIEAILTPAAFPAGVDQNRGSEETVKNPGVL